MFKTGDRAKLIIPATDDPFKTPNTNWFKRVLQFHNQEVIVNGKYVKGWSIQDTSPHDLIWIPKDWLVPLMQDNKIQCNCSLRQILTNGCNNVNHK